MSTDQARGHRRHQFTGPCVVRSQADGRLIADQTEDVSYSGVRVRAATDAVRLGERVEVSLSIPNSKLWLHGKGRVTRAIPGRRVGDAGPAIGIALDRMDGLSRVLMTAVASQLPLVPTTRGGRRDYAAAIARIARDA